MNALEALQYAQDIKRGGILVEESTKSNTRDKGTEIYDEVLLDGA